jgi:hypothetical protein|tara:strand:+ start:6813 stop:7310 length:498 start_codon:yes stop_codon:yes gene_type:complete
MIIKYGVLTEEVLLDCENFLENSLGENVWAVSELFWDDSLKIGVTGNVTMTNLPAELRHSVLRCIDPHVLPYAKAEVQLYVWHKNSGISMHDDNGRYGCTIYLNREWDINWGGIFIWNDGEELRALNPTYNMMVLNAENEDHMVTMVSPYSDDFRYSLQIWFTPV